MSDKHKRETAHTVLKTPPKGRFPQPGRTLEALFEQIRAEYPTLFESAYIGSMLLEMGNMPREAEECVDRSTQYSGVHQQLTWAGARTVIYVGAAGGTNVLSVMPLPVVAEGTPAEAESLLESSVKECAEAVTRAHEQIEQNRDEIKRLGDETRDLISKMLAA